MFDLNRDIPLLLSLAFIVGGLVSLTWSADRFIDSAGRLARAFGVSPLIVGMVIIGFGTSAPELVVSVLSGVGGHSDLSLGNAYGSCIFNVGAILGMTALIKPVTVKPGITFFAVPLLLLVSLVSYLLVRDGEFQRMDGFILLGLFAVLLPLYCWFDQRSSRRDEPGVAAGSGPAAARLKLGRDWFFLLFGLALLVLSSHLLVWGCVDFARDILGVSDLMIGLTVVAVGTSLPEFASAIVSARKGEHEFVIGNIVGSNFFNSLGVVGVAGSIAPFSGFSGHILTRDLAMVVVLTLSIACFGVKWRHPSRPGRINRIEGGLWFLTFLVYTGVMIAQETGAISK